MIFLNQIKHVRHFCAQSSQTHFVTTPIFYVNAAPHIGHLYSAVIADTINRFQQLIDPNCKTIFSTGTDEHGSKIQQAAESHKISTKNYCNEISSLYKTLFQESMVQPTRFIRTTDTDHIQTVQHFWKSLVEKNVIYSSNYSGWYCMSDETFLSEKEIKTLENGQKISEESGHPVEWTDEFNYMFKLSQFQESIIKWAETKDRIKPQKYQKILLQNLRDELPDISISRPSSRVSWGVPVPDDDTQTIYVWLDALVNYLTTAGFPDPDSMLKNWPPTIQVLGKDILKFHGIYWPGFLIAANLAPPNELFVHSHWTVDGQKMSKSKFNVVDPFQRAQIYTMEGLRYFLLREGVAHSDGNYSDTKIVRILNSELADTLGNLLSRCCAKTLNSKQIIPNQSINGLQKLEHLEEYKTMKDLLNELPDLCLKHYKDHNFYLVIDAVIAVLHCNNKFFEVTKPWELKKSTQNEEIEKLNTIIFLTIDTLRKVGIILQPIIPTMSTCLLDKLNVSKEDRNWNSLTKEMTDEKILGSGSSALFQRILLPKTDVKPIEIKKSKKVKKQNA